MTTINSLKKTIDTNQSSNISRASLKSQIDTQRQKIDDKLDMLHEINKEMFSKMSKA